MPKSKKITKKEEVPVETVTIEVEEVRNDDEGSSSEKAKKEQDTKETPPQKVEETPKEEEPFSKEELKEEEKTPFYKTFFWMVVPVILLIAAAAAGVFIYQLGVSRGKQMQQEETPVAQPTATPTPPAPTLKRADLKVQVLNGAGVAGTASSAQEFLEGLGYEDIDTDNAD